MTLSRFLVALLLALLLVPAGAEAARPHVVMLVFDELPTDSLLGPDLRIDAGRYPGFARLAAVSDWYPNATTVFDSTKWAVPAILDGRLPRPGVDPTQGRRRHNLFALLARHGYRMRVHEEARVVCPRRLCHERPILWRNVLDGLDDARPARLERTIGSISPTARPTLWFHHSLLPHNPWVFLPDGHTVVRQRGAPFDGRLGLHDPWLALHNQQRHLLQLGALDRLVGRLLDRLEATGLLRDALLVVTADHGVSFRHGLSDRRKVSARTLAEVAPVPLFVKAPGQLRGRTMAAYARATDVLPTMAALAGVRPGWRVDGRPVWHPEVLGRRAVRLRTRDFRRVVAMPARELEARRRGRLNHRLRRLGFGHWAWAYRVGPLGALAGRPVALLRRAPSRRTSIRLEQSAALSRVDPRRRSLPALLSGRLVGPRYVGRPIAAAVNGRIAASGWTFRLSDGREERFALLLPHSFLSPGRNRVTLYAVERRGGRRLLRRLPER